MENVMRKTSGLLALALLCAVGLAGCGSSQGERAASGAGIGAGVGAAGSAVTGGDIGTGAVIGGAVGAATGALTNEEDIDLGEPVWK